MDSWHLDELAAPPDVRSDSPVLGGGQENKCDVASVVSPDSCNLID